MRAASADPGPNDSHHIPPDGKHPFGCDYGDRAAEDTAREVRSLRRRGVRVAAVFMGEDLSVPGAENLVRIRSMDQLAGAAGALIRREIQEPSD